MTTLSVDELVALKNAASCEKDALQKKLAAVQAAIVQRTRDIDEAVKQGMTSSDPVATALARSSEILTRAVESVLRAIDEKMKKNAGAIFFFGSHTWRQYDESSSSPMVEIDPRTFYIGVLPEGGLNLRCHEYSGVPELVIPTPVLLELDPDNYGRDGMWATFAARDTLGWPYIPVPIGGWVRFPPVFAVGEGEIRTLYASHFKFSELILALKRGKNGTQTRDGTWEDARFKPETKLLIEKLPLPELVLA